MKVCWASNINSRQATRPPYNTDNRQPRTDNETRSRLKARWAHRLKAYVPPNSSMLRAPCSYPRNGNTIIASSGRRRLEGTLAISARASSLRPVAARTEACTATAEAETALLGTFKLA